MIACSGGDDNESEGVKSLVSHHTHGDLHKSLQISPCQTARLTSPTAFVGKRSERARNVHVAADNNITPTLPTSHQIQHFMILLTFYLAVAQMKRGQYFWMFLMERMS